MADSPLRTTHTEQVGPENKEYNLSRADEEYQDGNIRNAIYYLVKSHFQAMDTRYSYRSNPQEEFAFPTADEIVADFNDLELEDFKENTFMQSCMAFIREKEKEEALLKGNTKITTKNNNNNNDNDKETAERMNFLEQYNEPKEGYEHIEATIKNLPMEWTIVQLTKSFNTATTYSVFKEIYESDGAIYLTLLRHCRSDKYPAVCMRFPTVGSSEIFRKYATIIERFKNCISVDPAEYKTANAKQIYWQNLSEFSEFMESCIAELLEFFEPWNFLFKGRHYNTPTMTKHYDMIFKLVDKFCNQYKWNDDKRVLLSQAALHEVPLEQMQSICEELGSNNIESKAALDLLKKIMDLWKPIMEKNVLHAKRFPTILVVDERLDHFHWEQIATDQEFTRVKSLHCLWHLYMNHKSEINQGFYTVNIKEGSCIINPDSSLPNMSRRLRGFFEHWLPHWQKQFETKPKEDEFIKDFFKKDVYVYAGHGSGLQYISGKQICKTRINSVAFLFGCDSTRLNSNGLYSTLLGAHNYYHGALCPTVVGTLMPALDANMDWIAMYSLGRWIAPTKPENVVPLDLIDLNLWMKTGEVKLSESKKAKSTTTEQTKDCYIGSLCEILTQVQQRLVDQKTYNACIYVCRGLPAWNINVKDLPDLK